MSCLQGDQGFAGEPGVQGQKGAGEPGPKVRNLSSLFRTAASPQNQGASCLCLSRGSQELTGLPGLLEYLVKTALLGQRYVLTIWSQNIDSDIVLLYGVDSAHSLTRTEPV